MTWTKSGATITQTGTDADLSGLSAISGVTTTAFNSNFTIYDLGSNRLEIQGTLTHDPDVEMLVYSATGTTDVTTPVIVITSTGTYNYGVERTGNGNSAYSSGVGLMCVREDTGGQREWRTNQKGLIQNNSGTLNLKGGAISSAKPLGLAGYDAASNDGASTLNIKNTKIFRPSGLASSERREIRLDDATNTISGSVENLIMDGFLITHRNLPATFSVTLVNSAIGQLAGGPNASVLRDLDTSGNIRSDYDLGTDDFDTGAKFYTVINASEGSNTRCMPKEGVGGNRQLGGAIIQKEVSFNVKDSSGSVINGVKVYASDTDNSYRKNANGQDHTADKVYEYTTDANGDTETITVTTAITNIDSEDSSGTSINYTRWDTVNLNNRYKVDRRGLDDSGDDIFTFKFIEYGKSISTTNQALKGLGELVVNWVLFDDLVITEPNKAIVDDYQEIDTPQKFYDRAKAYLVDNFAGETSTIVSREGSTVNIGSYDLDVDANATAVFAFNGSKITIKASTFVGNITTTGGTISLLNGAEIVGTYGDISVLPFTITNVEAGSTVQLYNVTDGNEISNAVVSGTAGTKVTYSGTYANSLADPDDEVRLRITCQSGATALLPYESFGVATSAGISFKANQVDDTVYNNNAIDGSASSFDNSTLEIDADYTNFQLDVSDSDNPGVVTTQQIYAKYAYLITTSEGIEKFFGAITAENGSNYRINTSVVDLKIQNISTSDMIISGARLYRDDSATVIVKGPAGAGTLSHDTGEFLQYIQPQVTAAMNEYGVAGPSDFETIKKNSNLIPGLL